jgi:catechol 2,3-dioxygenase-like lactoylglutathione lyase family enzyme
MTAAGKITDVRTVGIPVSDQDRAIDFYVGTLGFDKRLDVDMGGGRRWIEVAPAASVGSPAVSAVTLASPVSAATIVRPACVRLAASGSASGDGCHILPERAGCAHSPASASWIRARAFLPRAAIECICSQAVA